MKIAQDAAEQELFRFLEKMDIEVDANEMTEEDTQDFNKHKNKLIKCIMRGSLVIDDEGLPTYTPIRSDNKDPIKFNEPSGSIILSMDRSKSNQNGHKLYASMAEMSKTTPARFSKMKMKDVNVCISIASLFLAQ